MVKELEKKNHLIEVMTDIKGKGFADAGEETAGKIDDIYQRLVPVSGTYRLSDKYGQSKIATMEDLITLSNMFDTDWLLAAGTDYGDPYAVRGLARTIAMVVAKGLPGSRSRPLEVLLTPDTAPKYLYVMLLVFNVEDHSGDVVKRLFEEAHEEFGGLDVMCSERYGAWDMERWCEERDIEFLPIFPTYDRQRDAFKQVLEATREGRFKCPELAIPGSKKEDIRDEEMEAFDHDSEKRWFGSVEKFEKYGIQDDFMFALGWAFYGARLKGIDDFRIRKQISNFGMFVRNRDLIGTYA
jgi:hypothetical protein